MKKFKADEWFVNPNGKPANIKENPYLLDLWDPGTLAGETVEIDGRQYKVLGVEKFMLMVSPRHRIVCRSLLW